MQDKLTAVFMRKTCESFLQHQEQRQSGLALIFRGVLQVLPRAARQFEKEKAYKLEGAIKSPVVGQEPESETWARSQAGLQPKGLFSLPPMKPFLHGVPYPVTVPPAGGHVFKRMSLWGTLDIRALTVRFKKEK